MQGNDEETEAFYSKGNQGSIFGDRGFRLMTLACCLVISSCITDPCKELSEIPEITPTREIVHDKNEGHETCFYYGDIETLAQAEKSLRKAGVCVLHIEEKTSEVDSGFFPCGSSALFHATVPLSQVAVAENAGWRDPYGESSIRSLLSTRNFLLQRQAEYLERIESESECGCHEMSDNCHRGSLLTDKCLGKV